MNPESLLQQLDVIAEAPNGARKLRELILQLAVRGGLVARDPSDEPVSVLLQRIDAEKRHMYSSGKISKPKPLAPVDPTRVPFAAPTSWEWVRLGTVAHQRLGKMLDSAKNKGTPLPYLRNTNVQWLRFELSDVKEMRFQADELGEYEVRAGDLLVCEGGEPGRCAVWSGSDTRMMFQKALHRVRPFAGVSAWYILYNLLASAQSGALDAYFTGATIKHMTGQSLAQFVMPLPPLAEQHRIVAKVDELMALCNELEARQQLRARTRARLNQSLLHHLTTAEDVTTFAAHWQRLRDNFGLLYDSPDTVTELRQAILQLALQGRLVEQGAADEPSRLSLQRIRARRQSLYADGKIGKPKSVDPVTDDQVPFTVPSGWTWCRLGDVILSLGDGPHFSPKYVSKENGVPFLSTRNVRVDRFDLSDVKYVSRTDHEEFTKKIRPELGDVLYTKGGTTGLAKVNDLPFEFSVWVHVAVLKVPHGDLDPAFLALALNSPHCYDQAQRFTQGSSNSDLGLTRMINITLPLPPLAEQHRIVARVRELMALCERLEAQLTVARECSVHLSASVVHRLTAAQP